MRIANTIAMLSSIPVITITPATPPIILLHGGELSAIGMSCVELSVDTLVEYIISLSVFVPLSVVGIKFSVITEGLPVVASEFAFGVLVIGVEIESGTVKLVSVVLALLIVVDLSVGTEDMLGVVPTSPPGGVGVEPGTVKLNKR